MWRPSWIFPHQSYLPNMVRNGLLSWIKACCNLRCCQKGSCTNMVVTTSSSIKDGRPESGSSERSKSPVSNFLNHLLHVLSGTIPSPNTFNEFLHASVANCCHKNGQNFPVDLIQYYCISCMVCKEKPKLANHLNQKHRVKKCQILKI